MGETESMVESTEEEFKGSNIGWATCEMSDDNKINFDLN